MSGSLTKDKNYKGVGAACVDPYNIKPTVKEPKDFEAFWNEAKADLAKIPIQPVITKEAEKCTADYDVYHVKINSLGTPGWGGKSEFYGMLTVPKGEGPFPAILEVPVAGE